MFSNPRLRPKKRPDSPTLKGVTRRYLLAVVNVLTLYDNGILLSIRTTSEQKHRLYRIL